MPWGKVTKEMAWRMTGGLPRMGRPTTGDLRNFILRPIRNNHRILKKRSGFHFRNSPPLLWEAGLGKEQACGWGNPGGTHRFCPGKSGKGPACKERPSAEGAAPRGEPGGAGWAASRKAGTWAGPVRGSDSSTGRGLRLSLGTPFPTQEMRDRGASGRWLRASRFVRVESENESKSGPK